MFSDLLDHLRSQVFVLSGLDKGALKIFFEQHELMGIWNVFRDYLFNFQMIIFIFLCFLLERAIPAIQRKKILNSNIVMDYFYPFLNAILASSIVGILLANLKYVYDKFLPFLNTGLLDNQPIAVQAVGAFLITDFMFYINHRLAHEVRFLWHFHAIHHSQQYLTPLTTMRGHAFSSIPAFIIRTIPIAIIGGDYPAWIAFAYINGFWGFFIHSNIKTNLGVFKYIFVSPQYHRVHHSREPKHFDMNYGERLILWDWMFGSLYKSFNEYPETGVRECEGVVEDNVSFRMIPIVWFKQFMYPFMKIYASLKPDKNSVPQ